VWFILVLQTNFMSNLQKRNCITTITTLAVVGKSVRDSLQLVEC